MTKNESEGPGDLGKQRPQVRSSVPAGQAVATTAEYQRGDAVGRGGGSPIELPPQFGALSRQEKTGWRRHGDRLPG